MRRSHETVCPRPSLGAFFPAVLGAVLGLVLAEELSWRIYAGMPLAEGGLCGVCLVLFLAVMAAIALAARGCAHRGVVLSGGLFAIAGLGACFCGALSWQAWSAGIDLVEDQVGNAEGVLVEICGDSVIREYGTLSPCKLASGGRSVDLRLLWPEDCEPASTGYLVYVKGSFMRPDTTEGGRWNHRNGYCGSLKASLVEDRGFVQGIYGCTASFRASSFDRISAFTGEGSCLLAGIVLGNRTTYAGTELEQDFKTCGLAHLMAVSGTHLAVVAALLSWLCSSLSLGRRARFSLVSSCLLAYVALTGFAPSAMRACTMSLVGIFAQGSGRRRHLPSALLFCILVFILFKPALVFSMGFQLSALAVAGLLLLAPLAQRWLDVVLPEKIRFASSSLAATLAATLLTLPVTIAAFCQLPLISPLSTLLAAPLITTGLSLGILGCLLSPVFEPLGMFVLQAGIAVCSACSSLVHALADLPFACLPLSSSGTVPALTFGLLIVLLWLAWPLPKDAVATDVSAAKRVLPRMLALIALFAPLAVALVDGSGYLQHSGLPVLQGGRSQAQVVMLDVGQGDSTLVRDGSSAVLIDTGKEGELLERGLARQGVSHLDAIFITHTDADHCGALSALTGVVAVDHVYLHADLLGQERAEDVERAARWVTKGGGAEGIGLGSVAHVGRFALTVVSPARGGEGSNEESLVQVLEYDDDGDGDFEARGLFTGDAESEVTSPLAAGVGKVDLLKVAHHGSHAGSGADELAVWQPKIALIGVGAGNDYGHPTRDTLERLAAVRAKVYRTDLNGDIAVGFFSDHLSVDVQKNET